MRTTRILSVAIEKYSDSAWDLPGVRNDADRMFALFREYCPPERYKQLRDNDATQTQIQSELIQLLTQTTEGDLAIFYYSGHGVRLPIKKTSDTGELDLKDDALFPYNSTTSSLIIDNWIGATIAMYLDPKARLFFIVDACHSGTILKGRDPFVYMRTKEARFADITQDMPPILLSHDATVAARAQHKPIDALPVAQLSAAKETQQAISTDLPDGVKGSTFTYAVTTVLRTATAGATWRSLQSSIVEEVAKLTNVHQPEFVFHGGSESFPVFPP